MQLIWPVEHPSRNSRRSDSGYISTVIVCSSPRRSPNVSASPQSAPCREIAPEHFRAGNVSRSALDPFRTTRSTRPSCFISGTPYSPNTYQTTASRCARHGRGVTRVKRGRLATAWDAVGMSCATSSRREREESKRVLVLMSRWRYLECSVAVVSSQCSLGKSWCKGIDAEVSLPGTRCASD
ncbi:hypothetical protein K458DRAFT_15429 [Lentithecium fluviatile CBS 122367]|uniref:Uncharacterized protein n=1 Tax=Lentithecium fluviatile CBS 122367 TaxID=1168545 RepID=A0A6G1J555_9PLEO|nr:hypothetical protein K458DRAFT_15429 [Lentithecium fluviatile CBS 122367]